MDGQSISYHLQAAGEQLQPALESAWAAPTFATAAEIIRYYVTANGQPAEWTSAENTQFIAFLNKLKNQYINNVPGYSINNNWTVSAGYAKMAIGVFTDDQAEYQAGMAIIKMFFLSLLNGMEQCSGKSAVEITRIAYISSTR